MPEWLTAPAPDRPLVGVVLKMPCPAFVELAGHAGADLVIIDTEHGAGDPLELEHHLRAADSAGLRVLVRVPGHQPEPIQAALDAGAAGVVVPHVSSRSDAEAAVRASHYPPYGERGLALTTRAGGQGTATLDDYLATARRETVVIAQIEDPDGVAAAEAIVTTDGIDGVWIGTNDLAMSLRAADSPAPADVVDAAVDQVVGAVSGAGVQFMMLAATPSSVALWTSRGATVVLATGHELMHRALTTYVGDVRAIRGD